MECESVLKGRKDTKFLLLSEEKVAAGGVSTALNAHTVLPPDDGRGGKSNLAQPEDGKGGG